MISPKKLRAKKCRSCRHKFQPARPLQSTCSPLCAIAHAQEIRKKKEAKEHREAKRKLETKPHATRKTQTSFNSYIRERDKHQNCISCDTKLVRLDVVHSLGGEFDCGHYRSVGSAPHLRFDERNAHGQCKKCNRWGSGRAVDYRLGLIKRIGLEAVESLEADQSVKKYTVEDLMAIRKHYMTKLKELKASR